MSWRECAVRCVSSPVLDSRACSVRALWLCAVRSLVPAVPRPAASLASWVFAPLNKQVDMHK